MKKILLLSFLLVLISTLGFSQSDKFWSANTDLKSSIVTDKAVARQSFPKAFKLFNLNIEPLRQELFSIVDRSAKRKTVISLPNAEGNFEQFEVYEASNFEPVLQARFPEIRAFSGKGITDKAATLKLSISPQGIQTMVFRTDKQNEFIEAYSKDHSVYAVFVSQRQKGQLPWTCSTDDKQMFAGQKSQLPVANATGSSAGELKTMRLAQSCNGEYANYFGATSAAQVALVLAAFNATLTRCNGVYENDLALHLNLVAQTTNVIYYDPVTDPYTTLANWNTQLQIALNTTLTGPATPIAANNAAYDIGHMFGASGGGGNAGCIGCVCVDGVVAGTGATKGRGITSPADNIPQGDNFDIDYVAHEVGHQLGGNHTFSMSNEGTGVNKEVGSGITVMGYAGITNQDVAPHSIDIFHEATIAQIQANLATKTCPITTNINATNATPVVSPQGPYTIPISTPFTLTGVATDANPGDVLTYCWEQNDDGAGQTGNNSVARENKPTGPNWLTFPATTSATRLFPKLSTVQAGLYITPVLPGGDPIADIEALSNVSRTLNFRLTVRDNSSYVPVTPGPAKVAQTAFTDVVVNVTNTSGPFMVTSPNTAVSWPINSVQTVTWNVASTTGAPVSCANVKISLSTDGGVTFPTVLVASTPNDGTESVTMPGTGSTTARIKVEAVGNIFYDMSNTNFSITGGAATPPTVTINQAAAQPDPTSATPINFTVVFDQPVIGFATGDVTLAGTAGATTQVVTGGPTTYNVAVSGMTSSGTVIATIAAGVCTNSSAQPNVASTSTDNTVTYNLPSGNDDCSGALPIACGQTVTGTTVGATIDVVPTCVTGLSTAPGVWYTFVGDGQNTTLSLCGSGYDTKIGVFTGTCAALVCVTGNDDFCGLQSQVSFLTVNGTTYRVLVTGFSTATGAFTLARTCAPVPTNDDCANAISIGCGQSISGTTVGQTIDVVPTCVTTLSSAPGVWYKFTGDGYSNTLSLCAGTSYDSKIGVFTGTCAALVCVTGNDDFCGLQSQVTFTTTLGTNYLVLVTGFSTATGPFTLTRTCAGPANDACFGALPIACGQTITGTTVGATPDAVGTCVTALGTAPSLWYTFVGNGVPNTLSLCGSAYDTKIGVFSGTCVSLVCVTGNDDFCGLQSQVTFTPVNGTTYYVMVGGFSTASGAFTLNRTCVFPPCTITRTSPVGSDNQAICRGSAIANITYATTVATSATFTGLPAGVTGTWAANVVTISGSPTAAPGVYNYTVTLVGCAAPTTATGTITVNPNASLVIVADPGTVLCEGDPTLLTVYDAIPGSGSTVSITHSSSNTITAGNSVACNAGTTGQVNSYWRAYNLNNFPTVTGNYTITSVRFGIEAILGGSVPITVNLYNQTGAAFPGGTRTLIKTQTYTLPVQSNTLYTATFTTPVTVPNTSTVIVEVTNATIVTGVRFFIGSNPAAETDISYLSSTACAINTPTPIATVGFPNMHMIIGLNGTLPNLGPQSTGTFVWSPAAGLSSTTSNPVAASPMNTTLYKVVRTTVPGGCKDSATITITVNKRPKVTTQPVNAVVCQTLATSFTVAGTGTGLTYQWQVNTSGCTGGTWTNIANGGSYSGATTATLNISPVLITMSGYGYRCVLGGTCAPFGIENISNCATLSVNPLPVVAITPATGCGGVVGIFSTKLSVGSAPPPVPGAVTATSGAINLAVPDNTANGVNNVINVAGVPANATITNVSVTLNMSHSYPGDMIFNLVAPNGKILNLYKYGTGLFTGPVSGVPTWGWYGATVSRTGTTAWSTVNAAPFIYNNATAWRADAINTPVVGAVIQNPTGFVSTETDFTTLYTNGPSTNGAWTLAMCDGGPGDLGTLASWTVKIDYTVPGGGGGPVLTYVWTPFAGLYLDSATTIPYAGSNTSVVWAAPTAYTTYTVVATDVATGCKDSAQAFINYTPPPPTVTPNPVAMCFGDAPVRLVSSSATTTPLQFCSGPVSIIVPDNNPAGATSNLTVSGVPASCNITSMSVTFNMTHTWAGDVALALKAPNGQILNLDYYLSGSGGAGATAGFTNTKISSTGTASLGGGASPFTGTFKADATIAPDAGPTGYTPTTNNWSSLWATPNGTYTLAMVDGAGGDQGTLTSWCIDLVYTCGVPSTAATWSPIGGLFNDAGATSPYTGTPRDTVWTQPAAAGVYNYNVTVQSVPAPPLVYSNPAPITINNSGTATPYPSNLVVSGLPPTGATVKSVTVSGISHTWASDVDILLQSPTGQNVILMSDVGGNVSFPAGATYTFEDGAPAMAAAPNPSGTYKPTNLIGTIGPEPDNWPAPGPGTVNQPNPVLSTFTGNMNGTWKLFVFDDAAGDQGSISGGYSVNFDIGLTPCTSPPRKVVVTVNTPTSITTQPVNQTICTNKVATFTVVAGGSGPFTYRWEVSTNSGNPPWTTVTNGGVYSGATTASLVITAPPVTMTGYQYRVVITGAAPCAAATSFARILTVNPLPVVVITANPTSLFPGMQTTLSATVSPNAASIYNWIRDGVSLGATSPGVLSGIGTANLTVNVDGLGDYVLNVTDVNGCNNTSNLITIKDSASAKCFLYPNPTNGQFEVRYYSVANNTNLPRTLNVYTTSGVRVLTQNYAIGRPYDRMPVDMRNHGKGVYFVEVADVNGNRLSLCKVVIL
ncbi:MAG: reprolysin-like metallopeptidase [Ferruginibacter sp.]